MIEYKRIDHIISEKTLNSSISGTVDIQFKCSCGVTFAVSAYLVRLKNRRCTSYWHHCSICGEDILVRFAKEHRHFFPAPSNTKEEVL